MEDYWKRLEYGIIEYQFGVWILVGPTSISDGSKWNHVLLREEIAMIYSYIQKGVWVNEKRMLKMYPLKWENRRKCVCPTWDGKQLGLGFVYDCPFGKSNHLKPRCSLMHSWGANHLVELTWTYVWASPADTNIRPKLRPLYYQPFAPLLGKLWWTPNFKKIIVKIWLTFYIRWIQCTFTVFVKIWFYYRICFKLKQI